MEWKMEEEWEVNAYRCCVCSLLLQRGAFAY